MTSSDILFLYVYRGTGARSEENVRQLDKFLFVKGMARISFRASILCRAYSNRY